MARRSRLTATMATKMAADDNDDNVDGDDGGVRRGVRCVCVRRHAANDDGGDVQQTTAETTRSERRRGGSGDGGGVRRRRQRAEGVRWRCEVEEQWHHVEIRFIILVRVS